MREIRCLRLEQEKHAQAALSRGVSSAALQTRNPVLMAELRGLRQRRDELERRMAGLQSSRRELMSQLEGLMRLLRAVCILPSFYCCYLQPPYMLTTYCLFVFLSICMDCVLTYGHAEAQ